VPSLCLMGVSMGAWGSGPFAVRLGQMILRPTVRSTLAAHSFGGRAHLNSSTSLSSRSPHQEKNSAAVGETCSIRERRGRRPAEMRAGEGRERGFLRVRALVPEEPKILQVAPRRSH